MSKQTTLNEIFARAQKRKHPDSTTEATSTLPFVSEVLDTTKSNDDAQANTRGNVTWMNNEDPVTPPTVSISDSHHSLPTIVPYHNNDVGELSTHIR